MNIHKNFFLKSDPKTPQAGQNYIKWINVQAAALEYLVSLSTEEHFRVFGQPQIISTYPNDCKLAGAELPCTVVPPSDDSQTTKLRPPQNHRTLLQPPTS
ncbi:hypothetical protein JTE90_004164 [Oedothorax gibbosus]|uniref:Uncharacterized protein n=1 Tax=Oedothorax gibbosus TaxID=931172 RepID=A0AAV6TVN9_9ARAC|nr:hypothetical protein JTE90_004164 [Oedothorax gibbosus]